MDVSPLDLGQLKVFPLAQRKTLTRADDILVDPDDAGEIRVPKRRPPLIRQAGARARDIQAARQRDASVMLVYGAHLLRNGAARILERMMTRGWITHLATNGAGTIHDWEYAWFGASTESVEMNVAAGTFGTWNETATNIHMALMAGALDGLGYGRSLGRFIAEDGTTLPPQAQLAADIAREPGHPLTVRQGADLVADACGSKRGRPEWPRHASSTAGSKRRSWVPCTFATRVPLTVHPGIGYDIISNHPVFSRLGHPRAGRGDGDFKLFGGSVAGLEGGVVLSVGSAIMGPQVFEKTVSCVNNLRLQSGQKILSGHTIYVVDIQDGGGWDWTHGEPPKTNPAYYLRFCKSYSRMGGTPPSSQCDNAAFVHNLYHALADGGLIPCS